MLRRFASSSTRLLPIASSSLHQSRLCSSTSSTDDRGNTNNNNNNSNTTPGSNTQQQQQQQQIPQVLQQFDQHMRTNPEFRKLYPKLLKAIVTNSKDDIVKVAEKMSQLTIPQSEKGVEEPKSVEKKQEEGNDIQQQQNLSSAEIAALALNLIVVDVAFADMFYHGEEEEQDSSASSSSPNPLEEEESDEELLQLLLSHFGEDFKKQKARIGKFVLETIQKERDQLMIKEKGLQILSTKNKKNATSAANRRSSAATLPNFAVTITPPIEAENRVTAKLLLKQIKTEVSTLSDFFDGDKQKIVASVLKRRVFSGAVGPWIHHCEGGETNNNTNNDEEKQIEQMTKALFQKQKKKAIGDVEFDPDVNMMACRVAVENDFVENKNRRGEDENTTSTTSSSNLLRFDIGIEESTFASSIGLDLFFDFEKDGDKAVNEMNDAVSEICKRVSERLNSGFRVGKKTNNDNDTGIFGEEAILPFAFTMRCKILMKQ